MIAGQQQLCCDAAERAEGAVAWVQGTVNVGALGGADASGLVFLNLGLVGCSMSGSNCCF